MIDGTGASRQTAYLEAGRIVTHRADKVFLKEKPQKATGARGGGQEAVGPLPALPATAPVFDNFIWPPVHVVSIPHHAIAPLPSRCPAPGPCSYSNRHKLFLRGHVDHPILNVCVRMGR